MNYVKAVELPGATMVISDSDVAIEDSVFSGLSFFGQGALVLANSNVTFVNVTFSFCNNSAGASLLLQISASTTMALGMTPLLQTLRTLGIVLHLTLAMHVMWLIDQLFAVHLDLRKLPVPSAQTWQLATPPKLSIMCAYSRKLCVVQLEQSMQTTHPM